MHYDIYINTMQMSIKRELQAHKDTKRGLNRVRILERCDHSQCTGKGKIGESTNIKRPIWVM